MILKTTNLDSEKPMFHLVSFDVFVHFIFDILNWITMAAVIA